MKGKKYLKGKIGSDMMIHKKTKKKKAFPLRVNPLNVDFKSLKQVEEVSRANKINNSQLILKSWKEQILL